MRYMGWNLDDLRRAPESYVSTITDLINREGSTDGDNAR